MCSATPNASKKIRWKACHFICRTIYEWRTASAKLTFSLCIRKQRLFKHFFAVTEFSWSHPYSCCLVRKHFLYSNQILCNQMALCIVSWVSLVQVVPSETRHQKKKTLQSFSLWMQRTEFVVHYGSSAKTSRLCIVRKKRSIFALSRLTRLIIKGLARTEKWNSYARWHNLYGYM